jgi:suppressor for copper-sensitivity B
MRQIRYDSGMTIRRISIALLPLLLFFLSWLSAVPAMAAPTTAPVTTALNLKSLPQGHDAVLAVIVDVPAGLHAQSNTPSSPSYIKFQVTMEPNPAVEWANPVYPRGEDHEYGQLGVLNVYTGRTIVYVPFKVKADAAPGPLKIIGKLQYQMCDDRSCFAPQHPVVEAQADVVAADARPAENQPEIFKPYTPAAAAPSTAPAGGSSAPTAQSSVQTTGSAGWSIWTAFGAALLAGLLFNVMPCVLPVLPLKAAAFHRAAEHHRSRSIMLGAAFSFGIILVFAILAVLVLVLRVVQWGSLFSNPWFVWSIVVVLLLCAMGMFGAFTLQLPTALYTVDPRQDTIGGNVVFGAFTAILATPCTAPLLPPLLIWASAQPSYVGVPAMLMVGVGMALPYLILSATPELAKRFPRTGPWAELFKQMMGFLLLASAAYFGAGRLIHGADFWWVVVAVIALAAFYLVAQTVQLTPNARPLAISAAIAVAMLSGSIWWTAKITGLTQPAVASAVWTPYSDDAFKQLRDAGKPVLVKFTANWCGTCQYIEGTVFRDPQVWSALKTRDFTAIKVDLTDENAPGKDLLLKLNPAGGIPLTAIYAPGKSEPIVLASVYTSSELLKALDDAARPTAQASAK